MQSMLNAMGNNALDTAEAVQMVFDKSPMMVGLGGGGGQSPGALRSAFEGIGEISRAFQGVAGKKRAGTDLVAIQAKLTEATQEGAGQVTEAINELLDGLKSNFGETGSLVLAIFANIGALMLNTTAIGASILRSGGGVPVGGGGGGAKKGGMLSRMASKGKSIGTRLMGYGGTALRFGGTMLAGAGAATAAAGLAATYGTYQAGQAAFTGRSDVSDKLTEVFPDFARGVGDILGNSINHAFAFFGNKESQSLLDAQNKYDEMKLAEERGKTESALARKKGVSPIKGVAPSTAGDVATVAPAGVATVPVAKAPEDDPINMELIKHTMQFDTLIDLLTQGNTVRQEMLDLDHGKINPSGSPSWLGTQVKKGLFGDAYTPLLDEGS
jgi:hypothetical protein